MIRQAYSSMGVCLAVSHGGLDLFKSKDELFCVIVPRTKDITKPIRYMTCHSFDTIQSTEYNEGILCYIVLTSGFNPSRRSPRQNRQDKNKSSLLAQPRLKSQPQALFLPSTQPSQHQYQTFTFPSGRVNLATPSTVSLLLSLSQQSVSVHMASEKTPEVGDKGTWSFLQRVAREQPFSFCGFCVSI